MNLEEFLERPPMFEELGHPVLKNSKLDHFIECIIDAQKTVAADLRREAAADTATFEAVL